MALEKQVQEGMSTKQKAMIGVVVIIVLIVAWQIIGLIGSGSSSAPAPSVPVTNKPVAQQNAKAPGPAEMNAMNNGQVAQQQSELKQAQVVSDTRFLQQQQMSEQKYIGKINDLEDLKVQRAIAETNQAIATAKLATVTAEKNISDLLTKPAVPEVSAAVYANKLTSPTQQGENAIAPADYNVISVSMQLGKWSAVIGYQGKLYTVVVGDVLNADHSVVTSISKNGVALTKDGKLRKISIMSSI